MKVIGEILMGAGLFIMLCGIAGLLKNPGFYRRLLLSSLIDTVGLLVLLAGVAVRQGLGSFSFKVISVPYTHLTLPTKREGEISVVGLVFTKKYK